LELPDVGKFSGWTLLIRVGLQPELVQDACEIAEPSKRKRSSGAVYEILRSPWHQSFSIWTARQFCRYINPVSAGCPVGYEGA